MIAYVQGEVVETGESYAVLAAGPIGYRIFMPGSFLDQMRTGDFMKVHTYLHVKEDAMQLYGFLTIDALEIFKLLLSVNGIGPKAALGILSALTTDELRFAVLSDDTKAICKAPGIGKKTAQKLILELKDKLDLEDAFEQKISNVQESAAAPASYDAKREAAEALIALGYGNSEALRAVKAIEHGEDMDVESLLKAALKNM